MYRNPFGCAVRCTAGYPKYPSGAYHSGEDYVPCDKSKEENWVLYSPCNAKVYISKKQIGSYNGYGAYGNYIVLQADDGRWILIAHMKTVPIVKAGQRVSAGQRIGVAGNTGNSSGRHTHIEVSNMKGIKYDGASWYERFKEHRVKPSDYISFNEEEDEVKTWKNGSTAEKVFQTTTDCKAQKNHIGTLSAHEVCACYGVVDGVYLVAYTVNGTTAKKCGFVKYNGGI